MNLGIYKFWNLEKDFNGTEFRCLGEEGYVGRIGQENYLDWTESLDFGVGVVWAKNVGMW